MPDLEGIIADEQELILHFMSMQDRSEDEVNYYNTILEKRKKKHHQLSENIKEFEPLFVPTCFEKNREKEEALLSADKRASFIIILKSRSASNVYFALPHIAGSSSIMLIES